MKKFYISLVAMFFAALTASAEDFMYEGLAYNIIAFKQVEVTKPAAGYTNLGGDLVIPRVVYNDGTSYTVIYIGEKAFQNCSTITSVTIPGTVESIKKSAFENCTNLATINFDQNSANLKEIRGWAFQGTAVTSVTIPESVKSIYSGAFEDCPNLTTVKLPNEMEILGSFARCPKLTTINLPEGIEYWGGFQDCISLKSITIPKSVWRLDGFRNTGLTSITIPSNVREISGGTFAECKNLTTVTIPSTVTTTGSESFRDCTGLTTVNIQNNMIAQNQFNGCTSLKTVNIGSNVNSFYASGQAFGGCPIETLNIGSNKAANIALYSSAKSTLKTLNLTDGVTELPESAFEGCSALTTVTLPSTLDGIGNSAFSGCTKMRELTAKMERPFAIDASVFSGVQQHGYCDLHVPQGSSGRYKSMEVWKEFYVIDEGAAPSYIRGDVNSDGTVDIADVVSVLNIMAEQ